MRTSSFICTAVCLILVSTQTRLFGQGGDYYSFYPGSTMRLGSCFSPNDLAAMKPDAARFARKPLEEGTLSTSLLVHLIESRTELRNYLDIDARLDASFLIARGSASFSLDEDSVLNENAVCLLLTAKTEFGRVEAHDPKLKPEAQKLINEKKWSQFEQRYGSQFVIMERRGASVFAFITIHNLNREDQEVIKASLHGGINAGIISASARADFEKRMKTALDKSSLTVQIASTGGQGTSDLQNVVSQLAKKPDAISKIQASLGDYLKNFTFSNAAPIGFHTVSMEYFGWKNTRDSIENLWTYKRETMLEEIVRLYREKKRTLITLRDIRNKAFPFSKSTLSDKDVLAVEEVEKTIGGELESLENLYRKTRTDLKSKVEIPKSRCTVRLERFPILPPPGPHRKGFFAVAEFALQAQRLALDARIHAIEQKNELPNPPGFAVYRSVVLKESGYIVDLRCEK